MNQLDKKLIQPHLAILDQVDEMYCLSFLLNPFFYENELIDTYIQFDGLALPSPVLKDLVGTKLVFDEDERQSFNGCLTMKSVHNPVDLYQLEFLKSRDGYLKVVAKIFIDFEYEQFDELKNLELVINSTVASQIL